MSTVLELLRQVLAWYLRPVSWGVRLLKLGGPLALVSLGVLASRVLTVHWTGVGSISFDMSDTPTWLAAAGFCLGAVLLGFALREREHERAKEDRLEARRQHVVLDIRGLRDAPGTPAPIAGPHTTLNVDVREHLLDGVLTRPERAVERVERALEGLAPLVEGRDPGDVAITAVGLAPVPLTFLAGVIADDERRIEILDWDRDANRWRELVDADDGERFDDVEVVDVEGQRVALCVSVSYRVRPEGVRATVSGPLVRLDLPDPRPGNHWSQAKQEAWSAQFLNALVALDGAGAASIDLFLAAPQSVVFRFGQRYDKRNLPPVRVHQYQREAAPPYPWSVQMPVAGRARASVVRLNGGSSSEPATP